MLFRCKNKVYNIIKKKKNGWDLLVMNKKMIRWIAIITVLIFFVTSIGFIGFSILSGNY